MTADKDEYAAFVEADAIITVPADSRSDAREYLDKHIKTGHLGPLNIRSIEQTNDG